MFITCRVMSQTQTNAKLRNKHLITKSSAPTKSRFDKRKRHQMCGDVLSLREVYIHIYYL